MTRLDLFQRGFTRVIDVYDGHVSQETMRQWFTSRVSWRIASADELNALQRDPLLVGRPEETAVLHQLSEERNHPLRSVVVHIGQIDFVAEQHQPFTQLEINDHNFNTLLRARAR